MKRIISILLVISLLVLFASCGNKADNEASTAYTQSSTKAVESTDTDITADAENTAADWETTAFSESIPESQQVNSNYPLDSKELHLLNLFLSNFAELYSGRRDRNGDRKIFCIDRYSDEKILEFVILNAYFNYNKHFIYEYSEIEGFKYQAKVSASYIQSRVKRFFDVNVPNRSTSFFLYSGDYYYYPAADGEFFPYFAKATSVTKNSDGTLNAEFNIYYDDSFSDNVPDNTSRMYYGYGDENTENCVRVGRGQAVLEEKYFGEDYGNYTVVSLSMDYDQ